MPKIVEYSSVDRTEVFGLCLFGDANSPACVWGMQAAMAEVPEQAAYSLEKRFSMYFHFPQREYMMVKNMLEQVIALLKEVGYVEAPQIGDHLDTCSSIDDLRRDRFAFEDGNGPDGYHTAGGFAIVMCKPGEPCIFSSEETKLLEGLLMEAAKVMFKNPPTQKLCC